MTTLEELQETERLLAAALEDVRVKIARDGAPERWRFETTHETWIKRLAEDPEMEESEVSAIVWNSRDRSTVFLQGVEACVCVEAAALFAWVDRVRELGETDL